MEDISSGISPCSAFHYEYEGPNRSRDTSPFTIHCTLEKGAEAYYSGVRVVVIAKKVEDDDDFAKAEIQVRRPRSRPDGEKLDETGIIENEDDVVGDKTPSDDGLCLYTLIFELINLSDATWSSATIKFVSTETSTRPFQIADTHRLLYEYTQRTTVHLPSCVHFLATRHAGLRRRLKPDNPSSIVCAYPAPMGPPTHGIRILPLSERRPIFTQLPPELLYNIFSIVARDGDYYDSWRNSLVAMSLVCCAWKIALRVVYEDFESQSHNGRDIGGLAKTLEVNPMMGRYIKRFSPDCFGDGGTRFYKQPRDALTILKTAPNMKSLTVIDVSTVLAEAFVEAPRKMTELRIFKQYSEHTSGDNENPERTSLNAAQLTKCFAHWPKLRQAMVYKFGSPSASEPFAEDGFAPAQCMLDEIRFKQGLLSMAQLQAMTASSQDTLQLVALTSIRGISNKELEAWLFDFGPNLTSLTLESNVFTRSEEEELAVDATIHRMPKLVYLFLNGPVATVLTLLRFQPARSERFGQPRIVIEDPMLFDPHAFVIALHTTKWGNVNVTGWRVSEENSELVEEANRVARERQLSLWIG
ncbi:hypothetical protein M422DRAFT_257640 [Sphaerobolus stellatus SS14]|uniref:Uncharacterized protein n=1 Tax=Sphaerobolus stellatus (strain SS14) TaxID=990650 RepID=A0A0C9VP32_SPHS4|nr:hypothetical protein M422DRAFT_257640 [Sphaerobolus stellatus SS14]